MHQIPLVSIIIPVYNTEKYLAETIQSALNQSYPDKEIIIIDDGSTDKSLSIANSFKNEHVRVFYQSNKGASSARNKGIAESKGDYIQFLDSDDLISPDKIKNQITLIAQKEGYLSICRTAYFMDDENHLSKKPVQDWKKSGSDHPVDFLIKLYGGALIGPEYGGMITLHSWLTPKKIIEKAGLWNEGITLDDDGEFFCRVVLASNGIISCPNSVNYYRKSKQGNTLSGQKTYAASQSALSALELKALHLFKHSNSPDAKLAMSRLFWEFTSFFYPNYRKLTFISENKARQLAPNFHYSPYKSGLNLFLSKIVGWKTIRYLQYAKNKIRDLYLLRSN